MNNVADQASLDIREGDIIDVTRLGVRVSSVSPGVIVGNSHGRLLTYRRDEVRVSNIRHPEPPKPEHWPPQEGDLWADEKGTEWFIYTMAGVLYGRCSAGESLGLRFSEDQRRWLSKGRLVHRRGDDPR